MVDRDLFYKNRRKVFAALALFLTLVCYSISSPIGSGPDTDYHLANIWCGWGETQGLCENQGRVNGVPSAEVPFMFQMCDERTIESFPACEFETEHPQSQFLRTQSGPDQNLYYKIMRVFASENPISGVIQIRILNSLITSLILFLILTLTTRRLRFAGLAAFTFTAIPNVLQYATSVNPRGWSILSVSTSWIFLYSYLESLDDSPRLRRGRLVTFLFVAFLAFATRIDASLMVVITSMLVYLSCRFRPERPRLRTSLAGLALIVLLYFSLQLFPRISAILSSGIPEGYGKWQYSIFQIVHIPEFVADWWSYRVGQSGNGPGIVGIVGLLLFATNLVFAIQKSDIKQRIIFSINSFIIFGMLTKSTIALGGIIPAPGIYSLGLAAPLLGITIATSKSNIQFMSSFGNRKTAIALLGFAHAISFYSWMEFYTRRGKDLGFYQQLSLNDTWWWDTWISPNFVFLLGALMFPVFLTYAWRSTPMELQE
jgi:hypothetical protein